jgi:hypothetical protein
VRQTKQATSATRQIHVSEKTYKKLRHASVELEVRLLDLAEEVFEAGFPAVVPENARQVASSN